MRSPEDAVRRAIARHWYCTLATSSAANRPLVTVVVYAAVDGVLYITTLDHSTKARNIGENPRVAVCIPTRRLPFAPPFAVQFQGRAELLGRDDPEVARLLEAGRLKKIVSHGELDEPACCFIRVTPNARVATYGVGVSMRTLLKDPLHADRVFQLS